MPIELSKEGPSCESGAQWRRCVCYLFSALQTPDLLLPCLAGFGAIFWHYVWCYIQILAGPFSGVPTNLGISLWKWCSRMRARVVFCGFKLLLQPLPAAQLFCIDPIDFVLGCWYSSVAPCLTKQALLGTECSPGPFLARLMIPAWSKQGFCRIKVHLTASPGQVMPVSHQRPPKGSQWCLSSLRQVVSVSQIRGSWWYMFQR